MPPRRLPPDDPREWLNRARSNLVQAEATRPDVYLEDLCFQAQQAVEKAFKALLLHRQVRFPPVHDLARLIHLLERDGQAIPGEVREAARLNHYAVQARYPGVGEPVSEEEYREALATAEVVVRWTERCLTEGAG